MSKLHAVLVLAFVALLAVQVAFAQDQPVQQDPVSVIAAQIADKIVAAAKPVRGDVADTDWEDIAHPTLYIVFADTKGILEGTPLTIKSKGDPIPGPDGEVLGYREKTVGAAVVTGIQSDRMLLARMETIAPGARPDKGDFAYVRSIPNALAMAAFEGSSTPDIKLSPLGEQVSDKLGVALQERGFRVIPRAKTEEALGKLSATLQQALADPQKRAALVTELQVPGVLTGTITRSEAEFRFLSRVMDAQIGVQIAALPAGAPATKGLDKLFEAKVIDDSPTRLFEALKPLPTSELWLREELGTCPIRGKLYDDCVGYRDPLGAARGKMVGVPTVMFDLSGTNWGTLVFKVGHHDTNSRYLTGGHIWVECDGRLEARYSVDEAAQPAQPIEFRVPLKGVRLLKIELAGWRGGIVVPGDFGLMP